jgi:hypothetical protein
MRAVGRALHPRRPCQGLDISDPAPGSPWLGWTLGVPNPGARRPAARSGARRPSPRPPARGGGCAARGGRCVQLYKTLHPQGGSEKRTLRARGTPWRSCLARSPAPRPAPAARGPSPRPPAGGGGFATGRGGFATGGGRPLHRDADAQPARPWRGCAGRYFRLPGLGGITRFAPPETTRPFPSPAAPWSVAATYCGRRGDADGAEGARVHTSRSDGRHESATGRGPTDLHGP